MSRTFLFHTLDAHGKRRLHGEALPAPPVTTGAARSKEVDAGRRCRAGREASAGIAAAEALLRLGETAGILPFSTWRAELDTTGSCDTGQ
jgi:hypothetical protein